MKCLFISNTRHTAEPYRDASTRYRCYNVAEALQKWKYIAHIATLSTVTPEIICRYDIVVFLRPEASAILLNLLNICEQRNIVAIADFDDLLFQPELSSTLPSVLAGRSNVAQAQKKCARYAEAMTLFNRFTVSTSTLAETIQKRFAQARIHCIPNALSSDWLWRNRSIMGEQPRHNELLYLPGSRSHDGDFASIKTLLSKLFSDPSQSDLKLRIIGPLSIDAELTNLGHIKTGPEWVTFNDLPQHIVNALACLAPLAITPFNRCKSHIKFIEAAAFGTPLIASAIPDMQRHKVEGLFFPVSTNQYLSVIERLQGQEYFHYCSNTLSRYVRRHCTVERHLPELLSFYTNGDISSTDEPTINVEQTPFSPQSVTLSSSTSSMNSRLTRIRRKTQKLIYSPRHFIRDSRVYTQFKQHINRATD